MTIEAPPSAAPATAPKMNVFQRIAGVFFAPAKTFEDIARRPDILAPLVILIVVSIVATIAIVPKMDFETMVRESMEQSNRGNMSADDMDRAARMGSAAAKVFAYASPIVGVAILALIAGVLLLAVRLFGGEGGYKQAFSATIYAWYPQLVLSILSVVIALSRPSIDSAQGLVMSHLGFLVDMKEQAVLYSLLSSIDLFTIWTVVLLIFGFAALSRLSRAKTAVLIGSLWIVMIVIKLALAALQASRAAA